MVVEVLGVVPGEAGTITGTTGVSSASGMGSGSGAGAASLVVMLTVSGAGVGAGLMIGAALTGSSTWGLPKSGRLGVTASSGAERLTGELAEELLELARSTASMLAASASSFSLIPLTRRPTTPEALAPKLTRRLASRAAAPASRSAAV